jgi:hypothetical protein
MPRFAPNKMPAEVKRRLFELTSRGRSIWRWDSGWPCTLRSTWPQSRGERPAAQRHPDLFSRRRTGPSFHRVSVMVCLLSDQTSQFHSFPDSPSICASLALNSPAIA